jgi:hypothetical protein
LVDSEECFETIAVVEFDCQCPWISPCEWEKVSCLEEVYGLVFHDGHENRDSEESIVRIAMWRDLLIIKPSQCLLIIFKNIL